MIVNTSRTSQNRWAQHLLLMVVALFACGVAPLAEARLSGVIGATMRDGGSGCSAVCHGVARGSVTLAGLSDRNCPECLASDGIT